MKSKADHETSIRIEKTVIKINTISIEIKETLTTSQQDSKDDHRNRNRNNKVLLEINGRAMEFNEASMKVS